MIEECPHEWKEEYYGTRCVKCSLFYPFGSAPWDTEDQWEREEDYIEMCGEEQS